MKTLKYIKPYHLWESNNSLYRVGPSSIHGQGCFALIDLPAETNLGLLHTILPDGYNHTELGNMYNHSPEPNCYNKRVGNQRFLVTIRSVRAGEELTGDYRLQPDLEQPQADWIGENEEEIAGLHRMAELGLVDRGEMKRRLKELGVDDPIRAGFIKLLKEVFAEAGVQWRDLATDRQSRNFTSVLNLTPREVSKIIFSGRWVEGLSPRQVTRRDKLVNFLQTVRAKMEAAEAVDQSVPTLSQATVSPKGDRLVFNDSSGFWFWIFQGSIRPSGWVGRPSSSDLVKFEEGTTPEAALARFVYQLILDASYRNWG